MIILLLLKKTLIKTIPITANVYAVIIFLLQIFSYCYHIYFYSNNPIFWYLSNNFDHFLSLLSLILLFFIIIIKSKSKYFGLEALSSVMFVEGIASIYAGFFILKWNDNEFFGTTIAMIGLSILIVLNKEKIINYGLWLAFELLFWIIWEILKIPAAYYVKNNEIVRGIYFYNPLLNIWIIMAWYIQVIVFLLFYYKKV